MTPTYTVFIEETHSLYARLNRKPYREDDVQFGAEINLSREADISIRELI